LSILFLSTKIRTLLFRRRRPSFDVIVDRSVMVGRHEDRRSRVFDVDTVDIVDKGCSIGFPARLLEGGKSSFTHDRYITTITKTITLTLTNHKKNVFLISFFFRVWTSSVLTSWPHIRKRHKNLIRFLRLECY